MTMMSRSSRSAIRATKNGHHLAPDINGLRLSTAATIRTQEPHCILDEIDQLRRAGVSAFRFVDDLFPRVIKTMMTAFIADRVGDWEQATLGLPPRGQQESQPWWVARGVRASRQRWSQPCTSPLSCILRAQLSGW
ncbi:hypothetical protein ACFVYA_21105 [Amycolatopsis sp. NPDC058278]|uniref:hypothetical protein n=1 Tax=Amycolatopsis sp. NPDC058278 TaxID=3346417 RepID=UPI0036DB539B